jgi:hypothetical protein
MRRGMLGWGDAEPARAGIGLPGAGIGTPGRPVQYSTPVFGPGAALGEDDLSLGEVAESEGSGGETWEA